MSAFFAILATIAFVAAPMPFWLPAVWSRYRNWKDHDPNDPATLLAHTALALLKERPEEWTSDHYNISHKITAISVWIANADYGITVRAKGATLTPKQPERVALATAFTRWKKGNEDRAAMDALADVRSRMRVYEGGKRD